MVKKGGNYGKEIRELGNQDIRDFSLSSLCALCLCGESLMKPKIIVVDDEPAIGELLTRFLAKNYEVTGFTEAEKALEYLKTNEVNLLLTDMVMPEMNGIELIKATRELKPNLPILLMTGTPNSELMKAVVELGISDYLVKPFQLDSLEKVIESRFQS